jgi:hypothetical protein
MDNVTILARSLAQMEGIAPDRAETSPRWPEFKARGRLLEVAVRLQGYSLTALPFDPGSKPMSYAGEFDPRDA